MSQNQNDNSLDTLLIAGMIILAYFVLKMWFGEELTYLYTQVRWGWLKAITFFWEKENLMADLRLLDTRMSKELTAAQLSQLSKDLRFFMFPIWGALVGYIGYKAIKNNPGRRFRRRLQRKDLAHEMSRDFPWILPALQQDLIKAPIFEGEWAMAMSPLQFARKFSLLNGKAIDQRRAEKLFASQLGNLWNGYKRLNPETQALFACFAAQVCRDKEGADGALRELVVSISANKPVWTKSKELLAKYGDDPRVQDVCKRHAYQYTVMIALFEAGKTIGIFPPNHFLWCRPRKRVLWYALNCVMRRTYFPEVSGIYAHFMAEKIAGHSLELPYVSKAVDALEVALQDIRFDSTEDELKRI